MGVGMAGGEMASAKEEADSQRGNDRKKGNDKINSKGNRNGEGNRLPVINIYVRTPFVSRGASDLGKRDVKAAT
jgi:hypothetical protein